MYTSDNRTLDMIGKGSETIAEDRMGRRTELIYLAASIFLAFAGAVYEHFSFGVYSYFMIYAFAIPLIGGALPFAILGHKGAKQAADSINSVWYHASIVTLTTGSVVQGILAICGRPNSLVMIYPFAAAILLAGAVITAFRRPAVTKAAI